MRIGYLIHLLDSTLPRRILSPALHGLITEVAVAALVWVRVAEFQLVRPRSFRVCLSGDNWADVYVSLQLGISRPHLGKDH